MLIFLKAFFYKVFSVIHIHADSTFVFRVRVVASSPKAAVYAGIKSNLYDGLCLRIIWLTLLIRGELAGLAGVCKVLSPIG